MSASVEVGEVGVIRLFWLPLGAGGRSVRINGRVLERIAAAKDHRAPASLFHSALAVDVGPERFVIEMTPVLGNAAAKRGVVAEGPVAVRWAGRSPWFRYEVRCWSGGQIDDVGEALASPVVLSGDPTMAQRLVGLVAQVPTPTWGRDELSTGGMWNSNSLTSWLIVRSGLSVGSIHPPAGGRAPGWHAGCVEAARADLGVVAVRR